MGSRKKQRESGEDHWKGCFWPGCQGNGKEPAKRSGATNVAIKIVKGQFLISN